MATAVLETRLNRKGNVKATSTGFWHYHYDSKVESVSAIYNIAGAFNCLGSSRPNCELFTVHRSCPPVTFSSKVGLLHHRVKRSQLDLGHLCFIITLPCWLVYCSFNGRAGLWDAYTWSHHHCRCGRCHVDQEI